ncbi:MAG TPA: nuclear transport factor 2 family protein [Rhizomicrobium sp.]|nr:nuclear transport factor 2 family protein [Rhizomicrobium sp.]
MKYRLPILATVAALASFVANFAVATDKDDVMATLRQYDEAFNKNDMKAWNSLCTDNAIILDDFAPYVWQGAKACGDWWSAFDASAKKAAMTSATVRLGEAWHVTVTGDRAYAVYPTRFTFKLNGKPVSERGVWTMALQKLGPGWRISGWGWAQH